MYEKFRDRSNFQAMADMNMGKLIAARERKIRPEFMSEDTRDIKPNKLYQQYLKNAGILPVYSPPQYSYCNPY